MQPFLQTSQGWGGQQNRRSMRPIRSAVRGGGRPRDLRHSGHGPGDRSSHPPRRGGDVRPRLLHPRPHQRLSMHRTSWPPLAVAHALNKLTNRGIPQCVSSRIVTRYRADNVDKAVIRSPGARRCRGVHTASSSQRRSPAAARQSVQPSRAPDRGPPSPRPR
jgi:hypothetical protein